MWTSILCLWLGIALIIMKGIHHVLVQPFARKEAGRKRKNKERWQEKDWYWLLANSDESHPKNRSSG